jgi:hypothetical protein
MASQALTAAPVNQTEWKIVGASLSRESSATTQLSLTKSRGKRACDMRIRETSGHPAVIDRFA